MRNLSVAVCLLALTASIRAQVIGIDDLNPATGAINTFPWAQAGGFTTLHVYSPAALYARGVCAGAVLTDLAVAPANGTTGTYSAPSALMQIGHLSVPVPVPGAWGTHLASPITVHSLTSGPYSFPWTFNTYASLPGFAAAGFTWDGVRSIGILYTSSSGVTGLFQARRSATELRHAVAVFNATTQLPTSNGLFAMEVRMSFTPGTTRFQVNSPDSSLSWNGVNGTVTNKANTNVCPGALVTVTGTTALPVAFFEWGYNLAATVPCGGGATATSTGQLVNLDIGGGGLFFLNGGLAPTFFPHAGAIPLSFGMPGGLTVSAQQLVVPTSHPDGFTLSQAGQINGVTCPTNIPGPVGDDVAFSITAGAAPHNFPVIALYGTSHTQYHVITNGRITMGPFASTSFSPTLTYGVGSPPFAGAFADFNTNVAGNVTIDHLGNGLRANYNAIGYFGQPGTASTLSVSVNSASAVSISNVTLGLPIGSINCYMGVHPGGTATVEAGFPTTYVGAGVFTSSVAGRSHGAFGNLFAAPLTDPADNLNFTYNGSGGYNVTY